MTRSIFALMTAVGCFAADGNQLLDVKRIYVDKLGGASSSAIRDMLINALQSSRLFQITEDPTKADAFLRGSADDDVYNENFQMSESVRAGTSLGSGAYRSAVPRISATVGEQESVHKTERRHEALAAVRLVSRDGDVIWATTQESQGAKFRGAGSDVAEKVVRQLLADLDKVRKPAVP